VSTARKRRQSKKEELKAKGLTLEELEKRVKVANEILRAININVDFDKIDAILKSLDYETYRSIDEHKLSDLMRYIEYELPVEIKESIVRAVLGEHYIDPASVDYDKVGFKDWKYDECPHYAFVKIGNKYAIIYACDDELAYSLPSA